MIGFSDQFCGSGQPHLFGKTKPGPPPPPPPWPFGFCSSTQRTLNKMLEELNYLSRQKLARALFLYLLPVIVPVENEIHTLCVHDRLKPLHHQNLNFIVPYVVTCFACMIKFCFICMAVRVRTSRWMHPRGPAYAGPAPPNCTSGVPTRASSASHAHAHG
jgi:hypothetical protein